MNAPRARTLYPVAVGLLLGLLQTGLFFQLTFTLSSGFTTYLLVTLCWLTGSAIGVYALATTRLSLRTFLVAMLAAYAVCGLLVTVNPFNTRLWVVYALLIGLAGVYPGVFFARASQHYAARSLFFLENNGFVAGLVLCTLLFMVAGRGVLWLGPVAAAAGVWWMSGPGMPQPATDH